MAEFPAFPLWTDAYLADTHHLTTIEHGAYLLLLIAMWRNDGALPNDDRELARFAHLTLQQWQRIRPNLLKFFRDGGAVITQGRLTDELAYVKAHSKKQAAKARSRWAVEQTPPLPVRQPPLGVFDGSDATSLELLNTGDAAAMPDACRSDAPTPTPTIYTPNGVFPETTVSGSSPKRALPRKRNSYPAEFDSAWAAYPTSPNMSKSEAFKAWSKLDDEDRAAVVKATPGFIAHCKATPDYQPVYFDRFIRQRRFDGFAGAAAPAKSETPADWTKRLNYAREKRRWDEANWGPVPNRPGSRVPSELLQKGDGTGWLSVAA